MMAELLARLVLASASPRRAEILRTARFEFEVVPAGVDETEGPNVAPADLAVRLASMKARAVAAHRPDAAVLAADTVVAMDGESLGKPSSPVQALEMLRRLRGREHAVITAVCLARQGRTLQGSVETGVRIRRFSQQEAEAYVSSGAPLDKAGAYGIQDRPFSPVASYDGCYLNVVGLPLCLSGALLRDAGLLSSRAQQPSCPGHTAAVKEVNT
jgi:MAF protein